jgi:hypothetical protein
LRYDHADVDPEGRAAWAPRQRAPRRRRAARPAGSVDLDARGDMEGVTVSLSVKDGALLPELKRRAAHELETAQHRGSGTSSH